MAVCLSAAEPATPTAWELFLSGLGLTEEAAREIAAGHLEGPRASLRNWVREHRRRRFVPDAVLTALGLALNEAQVSIYPENGVRSRGAFPAAE